MAGNGESQPNMLSKEERRQLLPLMVETKRHQCSLRRGHQRDQPLRRAISEMLTGADDIVEDFQQQSMKAREAEVVECECCGMSEECTPTYISRVKEFYCGKWVCGLCSEAVKEQVNKKPAVSIREALESHMTLCIKFNRTVRLNPELSFARSMSDIARRSSRRRTSEEFPPSRNNLARTSSCGPGITVEIEQSPIQ